MKYLFVGGPVDGMVADVAPGVRVVTGPWPGSYALWRLSEKVTFFHYTEPVAKPDRWAKPKRSGGFPPVQRRDTITALRP